MPKAKLPTRYQSVILRRIARSCLVKTYIASRDDPMWSIDGQEISHECAKALIRNGWVVPNRDGLSMFDETQSYYVPSLITGKSENRRRDDGGAMERDVPEVGTMADRKSSRTEAPLLTVLEGD